MPKAINLKKLEHELDLRLKEQTQVGLSKLYEMLGCSGIAKEIKAGRNVTGNTEYGIRLCVHNKIAPRVDPETLEFFPMSKKNRELEEKFISTTNKLLESGGFKKISPSLLSDLRKKDKKFEEKIKKLRKNGG